ncbi:MAG: hypothetical protein CM1200mP40_22860 [Gammaproteobacteria bacterium]|nr:MAG: hypothetical protein CM1200mP40_22860 [Gammaproteobacteria bacterium]
MTKPIRFGIVAGEKSGDILGASLIEALRTYYPDAEFVGVAGPAMLELGCKSITPMDRLSVMGFVEPLSRLPELLKLKKDLQECFTATSLPRSSVSIPQISICAWLLTCMRRE